MFPADAVSAVASATPPAMPVLAHVPILNQPAKSSEPAQSLVGSELGDMDVPAITNDQELCQYCVKCFTDCSIKLKDQQLLEVRLKLELCL